MPASRKKNESWQFTSERPRERAVIAGIPHSPSESESHFTEIKELLDTAGVDVIGEVSQKRDKPHPVTYLGTGKFEDLCQEVKALDPDIVVIDDELSPRQQRTIEDAVERRVLDRTAVILDIFALHAHTADGKLQVELAQLEYNLQRMRGLWKHLERLGGGVGTRGPGESQLETDRRLARRRISLLRSRLKELEKHRATMRSARSGSFIPKIALAGYTNAGKSTLLNHLTDAGVSEADRLFETLDPTTRSYESNGRRYLVTDTVGFIERLPHQLVDAFRSTLDETLLADLVVLVADASHGEAHLARHIAAVDQTLKEIGGKDLPRLLALNKIDLMESDGDWLRKKYPDAILISAKSGDGISDLLDAIAAYFAERWQRVELVVPYSEAGVLSRLYEAGAPVEREDTDTGILATAHVPSSMVKGLKRYMQPVPE